MLYTGELPDRTFLKPSEVALLLNVSPKTVYLWHDAGKIDGIKIRGSLRIFTTSLARLLGRVQQRNMTAFEGASSQPGRERALCRTME